MEQGNWPEKLCRGRLLSLASYQADADEWGYEDGRSWDEQDRGRGGPSLATGELDSTHGPH